MLRVDAVDHDTVQDAPSVKRPQPLPVQYRKGWWLDAKAHATVGHAKVITRVGGMIGLTCRA